MTNQNLPRDPRVEGDRTETYWSCPECDSTLCTWTQCPGCGWHDTSAWNRALAALEAGTMSRRVVA